MWQLQWGVGNRVVGHGRAGKSARTRGGALEGDERAWAAGNRASAGGNGDGHERTDSGRQNARAALQSAATDSLAASRPASGQRRFAAMGQCTGRRDVAWHGRRHRPWRGQWANCRHATKRPGQRGWARAAKAKGPSGPEQPPLVSAGAPTHVNMDRAGQGRTARTAVRTAAPHQHNGSSPASVPHQ